MPYSSFGLGLIQSWGYEFVCSAAEHETTVGSAAIAGLHRFKFPARYLPLAPVGQPSANGPQFQPKGYLDSTRSGYLGLLLLNGH